MRDRRDFFEIDDDAAGVGEVLDKDRLGARGQRAAEILGIGRVDKIAFPAELFERQAELGQRAAVEIARGEKLVARLHQREKDQELRGMARGGGDRGAAAFEARDPLFEHRDRRVVQPRIDVAEIVQVEERGGVVDIVEHIGRGLVDRGRARAGCRVGCRTGMHRARFETIDPVVRSALAKAGGPRRSLMRRASGGCGARFLMMPLLTPLHDNSPPSRPNSIFGQRFMTTSMPAASALAAASSLRMPSCIHTTLAPIAIASSTIAGASRAGAEHIDHVDRLGDVAQRGVDLLAEQALAGDAGIDRDHPVAFVLQILHDEIAGPVPVRRGADHRDRPHPLQDRPQLRIGIRDRFETAHRVRLTKLAGRHLQPGAAPGVNPPPPKPRARAIGALLAVML